MENKFRCHPSIILEKISGIIGFFIIILIPNLDDLKKFIDTGNFEDFGHIKWLLLVGFIILVIDAIYNILVWRKTYISIDQGTIIIERNTINKKINTFGIKNIANINIEQNLFERIISTCKVKIDTDSLSTADQTDIEIVLKKNIADEFKRTILEVINQNNENLRSKVCDEDFAINAESCEGESDFNKYNNNIAYSNKYEASDISYDIEYSSSDVLKHCLYNISILGLFVNICIFVGLVVLSFGESYKSIWSILVEILIIVANFGAIFKNIFGDYVKYYNFKVSRKGDKIYLNYGLFKQVEYSILVDRINGLNINQSILGRIFNKYKIDVDVIGISDNENESSQITLFESKDVLLEKFDLLLPEFKLDIDKNFEKQSNKIFSISFIKSIMIVGVIDLIIATIYELNLFRNMKIIIIANVVLILFLIVYYFMKYKTAGIYLGDSFVSIMSGRFSKRINIIQYRKIQYIDIKQGPVSKSLGLNHGEIYILAGSAVNDKVIDYYDEKIFNELVDKI